jgi:hypothetical protein
VLNGICVELRAAATGKTTAEVIAADEKARAKEAEGQAGARKTTE